jgi:hypothetical protein
VYFLYKPHRVGLIRINIITFATWFASSGVPVEIIETISGWSRGGKNKMVNINTHIDDVTDLLPYVNFIDDVLSGKKKFSKIFSTVTPS